MARRTGVFANRLLVGVALDDISIETLELWYSHEWQSFMPGVLCATKAAVASAAVSAAGKVHIDMGPYVRSSRRQVDVCRKFDKPHLRDNAAYVVCVSVYTGSSRHKDYIICKDSTLQL